MALDPDDEQIYRAALEVLFDKHPDGIYVLRPDSSFLAVNEALVDRLQLTREQLLAMTFLPTVGPSDLESVKAEFAAALAGQERSYVATGKTLDGKPFRVDILNLPLRVDDDVVAVLGIARDVDQIEAARAEHQVLEDRFQSTLNAISVGVYFLNREFEFTYVNPRAEQIAQRSREDLIGKSLWDEFPLMRGSEFGIGYNKALANNETVVIRDRYEPYDVTLEATAYPTSEGLAVYVRDVTEEEAHLAVERERDRALVRQADLLDASRDAMLVRDLEDTIQYWNKAAANLYGWSANEAVGRSVRDLIYASPEAFDVATAAAIANGEWSGDMHQLARDGSPIIAECHWSVVRSDDGTPEAIFCVNTDVTQRRKESERTQRADRMESLGTLAGGIAHDLNNVLTPLLMSVQLLELDERDPSRRATLDVMETSIKRGADMIRQVLTFARGVEGRRVPVSIEQLIDDTLAFCYQTMPKSIRIADHLDELRGSGITAIGDPTQLLQVMLNLTANARDAMPDGGTLTFGAHVLPATEGSQERAVITVADTGDGIDPAVAARMFEPFYTTKVTGTGLGLATSDAIVRSHSGEMSVVSSPGHGATFEVTLPVVSRLTGLGAERQAAPSRGGGQLILVVDDEVAIRHSSRTVLESLGYRVAVAGNGKEALDYLANNGSSVDLIVTDLVMPVLDGRALLAQLAELYPHIPAIIMSSYSEATGVESIHLAKPFTLVDLARIVEQELSKPSL